MRNGELRCEESAAAIDRLDQIVAFDGHALDIDWVDSACIVDHDVDAAKGLDRLLYSSIQAISIPDIALDGEGTATGLLNFLCCRIDGPFQLRVRCDSLGGDGNICTVACAALCDFKADTTGGACDEDGLAT